jgi:hypothetical protein
MSRNLVRIFVLALAVGSLPVAAGAQDFATRCVSGSVMTADALAPQVYDPAEDQTLPGPGHGEATDLRAVWISGEDGSAVVTSTSTTTPDGSSASLAIMAGRQLTANIRVTDLLSHPVNASYRMTFTVDGEERFVSAQALPDGDWAFFHGIIDRSDPTLARQVRQGPTGGGVDMATGVISVDLVGDFQLYPTDGAERRLQVDEVRSQLHVGSPYGDPTGQLPISGLLVASDTTANGQICRTIIFAEGEEVPGEPVFRDEVEDDVAADPEG